jgi:DNA-binding transcriptional regulator YhcF (GntR family)
MANTLQTKAEKVAEAKRLYCGIGLTLDDCPRMIGDVIATGIGVHPHTLDAWIIKYKWRRPRWYRKRRPYPPRGEVDLTTMIGEEIERVASAGHSFPTNHVLARRLNYSVTAVRIALRDLVATGEISTERDGPRRRLRLHDGRMTAWSVLADAEPPEVAQRTKATRNEIVLQALKAAAIAGAPCPSNHELAARAECRRHRVDSLIRELLAEGAFRIERRRGNQRRLFFADGTETAWSLVKNRHARAVDIAAAEAVTALRRMGHALVFDVAVYTGKAWGVTWSVDGKLYGRAALIAYAAERRSASVQAMHVGEGVSP